MVIAIYCYLYIALLVFVCNDKLIPDNGKLGASGVATNWIRKLRAIWRFCIDEWCYNVRICSYSCASWHNYFCFTLGFVLNWLFPLLVILFLKVADCFDHSRLALWTLCVWIVNDWLSLWLCDRFCIWLMTFASLFWFCLFFGFRPLRPLLLWFLPSPFGLFAAVLVGPLRFVWWLRWGWVSVSPAGFYPSIGTLFVILLSYFFFIVFEGYPGRRSPLCWELATCPLRAQQAFED